MVKHLSLRCIQSVTLQDIPRAMVENKVDHCVMSGRHNFATEKEMSPVRSRKASTESKPHSPMESRRKAYEDKKPRLGIQRSDKKRKTGNDHHDDGRRIEARTTPGRLYTTPAKLAADERRKTDRLELRRKQRSIKSGTSQSRKQVRRHASMAKADTTATSDRQAWWRNPWQGSASTGNRRCHGESIRRRATPAHRQRPP